MASEVAIYENYRLFWKKTHYFTFSYLILLCSWIIIVLNFIQTSNTIIVAHTITTIISIIFIPWLILGFVLFLISLFTLRSESKIEQRKMIKENNLQQKHYFITSRQKQLTKLYFLIIVFLTFNIILLFQKLFGTPLLRILVIFFISLILFFPFYIIMPEELKNLLNKFVKSINLKKS